MSEDSKTPSPVALLFVCALFGGPQYREALELRERVLRRPLGIPLRDVDTADDSTEELFCVLNGEHVIACLQLKPIDAATMKLRQMAVEPAFQKAGVGSALVRFAEDWARASGIATIVLDARADVTAFYEKLGYSARGEPFVSVGIAHQGMVKALHAS